jgi:3-hydroxymyristoyl/3-hydroxydecanoyl-(acyl carrier protein) dehydratase
VKPDDWFLTCHFVDDMVMPGTLMYECCLHTLRVLLMRMGWVGEEGEVACEPAPGVASRLKCRGQVIATTKVAAYEVSIKELGYGPEPYCIADALMYADGKPIVEMTNLALRMTGLTREKLEAIWGTSSSSPPLTGEGPGEGSRASPNPPAPFPEREGGERKPALYDSASIRAFSNGNPSEAFGEPYRPFDRDRIIARLPGPPFQFLDRVTAVSGEPFVLRAGTECETQYDVPPDAWYFAANRSQRMPFSVLLEVALQPCGWLAAYSGSALAGGNVDLKFRNLGGQATQHLAVTPDIGTLTVNARMTNVSRSAGMIIQHFDMRIAGRGGAIYEGTTYFGFFAADALTNQVGMPAAKVPFLSESDRRPVPLPRSAPFPDDMMRMVDRIDGYLPAGGKAGFGLVQGSIDVDPSFWFFAAHFFQDPVWPGSLGVESFLQLLKFASWKRWGEVPAGGWQTPALGAKHEWTYRGQVVPADRIVTVILEVTAVDEAAKRITADGFLTVDGRVIYQMTGFTLE